MPLCSWSTLVDAAKGISPDALLSDASFGLTSSFATISTQQVSDSAWWIAPFSKSTADGGVLVSSSFLAGHGTDELFPSGYYVALILITDDYGVSGSSVVGMSFAWWTACFRD